MKSLVVNIILIFVYVNAFGQDKFEFEYDGKDFTDSLKSCGVDSIYSVKTYCVGNVMFLNREDNSVCDCKSERRFELNIFWKHKSELFVKKFNNCYEFETLSLDSLKFQSFYAENRNILTVEKIETSGGFEIENGDTLFLIYDVDHYCKLDISFVTKDYIFKREFYDYDFEISLNNDYGKQNQELKLYSLYCLITDELLLLGRGCSAIIVK